MTWINVKDRLPEVGLILVFQNGEMFVYFYDKIRPIAFSHWMLLPDPPNLK